MLQRDYALEMADIAQILGVVVRYRIANLAGRSVGIAAMLEKRVLGPLPCRQVTPVAASR